MRPSTVFLFVFALAATASPLNNRQTVASGNDGSGDQKVGNAGQNSGSAAANKGKISGDYTVEQGAQTCGNAQLNCCNKVEKMGDTNSAGVLGSVFGSGDVGVQCTPLNVPLLIALQVPINKACDAKAACCQGDNNQNGVANVGCVALTSLI
ncbi:hypothetical protein DFP73DRAFT_601854 [Morchella snyderi]|nr:hypothetical protein DFP73DRAFT_601854 [Morchella snyderi]